MPKIVNVPEHGATIIIEGRAAPNMQAFMDELLLEINGTLLGEALKMSSYTVSALPPAASWTGSMVYVSDETGGAVTAFSDGSDWRRTTDRAVVS